MNVRFYLVYVNSVQSKIKIILKLSLYFSGRESERWNTFKVKTLYDNWISVLDFLFDVTSHHKILQALCIDHL